MGISRLQLWNMSHMQQGTFALNAEQVQRPELMEFHLCDIKIKTLSLQQSQTLPTVHFV